LRWPSSIRIHTPSRHREITNRQADKACRLPLPVKRLTRLFVRMPSQFTCYGRPNNTG
jgi:hypothetical protein